MESRLSRGWDTQEKARTEIARLTGWQIPQSVYAEWESGRRVPSDANLERLHGFYGTEETGPALSEAGEVAQAIREQTAVMRELLDELRHARRESIAEAVAEIHAEAARLGFPPQADPPPSPADTGSSSRTAAPAAAVSRP